MNKCIHIHKKSDWKGVRLIWSAEKKNVKQTVVKIGQSGLNMQAVPLEMSSWGSF